MPEVALQDYLEEIDRLIEDSHLGEAVGHCRHILRQFPRHVETYRMLGKALLEKGDLEGAGDILQRVLSADPEDFISHAGLAIVHKGGNRLDDAAWHMERAFEVEPYNGAIRETLQDLVGRRDGLPPEDVTLTQGALARLYVRGELFAQAISALKQLIEEMPERMDLHVQLAEALWRDGQRIDAAEECSRILERLPFCIKANAILAEVWLVTDRVADAQPYLRRVFELVLPSKASLQDDSVIGIVFGTEGSPALPDAILLEKATVAVGTESLGDASDWVQDIDFGEELVLEDVEPAWLDDMKHDTDLEGIELEVPAGEINEAAEAPAEEVEAHEEVGEDATSWFNRSSDQLPGIGEFRQETDWEAWLEHGSDAAALDAEESHDVSADVELEESDMAGKDERNQDNDDFPEGDESTSENRQEAGNDGRNLDWLDELQEAAQPSPLEGFGEEGEDDLPDWLGSAIDLEGAEAVDLTWLDEGGGDAGDDAESGGAEENELPDWLQDEMVAESDETESAFDEDLSWLDQIAAGGGPALDEPPTMSWPDSEPSGEAQTYDDEPMEADLQASGEADMAVDAADEAGTVSFEASQSTPVDDGAEAHDEIPFDDVQGDDVGVDDVPEDIDEAMVWLEQLAAQQGAPADELPSLAGGTQEDEVAVPDDIESAVDWLDELAHTQGEEGYEALAIGEEQGIDDDAAEGYDPELTESVEIEEEFSVESPVQEIEIESGIGRAEEDELAEIDEAMAWLQELAASETDDDELLALDDLEDEPDLEALSDLADLPDDPEQALAWLEGLASGESTKEPGEQGIDVVREDQTPSVPFDVVAARAEAESILLHDEVDGEEVSQDAEILEDIPDDPDEAMAWLEKLAARQGASLDELPSLSEIEEDVETPGWLAEELEAALEADTTELGDEQQVAEVDISGEEGPTGDILIEESIDSPEMDETTETDEVGPLDTPEPDAQSPDIEDESLFDDLIADMELESFEEEGMLPDWLSVEGEEDLTDLDDFSWDEESFDATGWLESEEHALQVGEEEGVDEVIAAPEISDDVEEVLEHQHAEDEIVEQEETVADVADEGEPVVGDDALQEPKIEETAEIELEIDIATSEGEAVVAEEITVSGEEEALQAYEERLATGDDLPSLIASLEQATQMYETQPRFLQLLGDAYSKNGQLQKALDAYRRALDSL